MRSVVELFRPYNDRGKMSTLLFLCFSNLLNEFFRVDLLTFRF